MNVDKEETSKITTYVNQWRFMKTLNECRMEVIFSSNDRCDDDAFFY